MDLTGILAKEWHLSNRAGICRALVNAYRDVNTLCDVDRHAFFGTPNRVFALGYNRWVIVDHWVAKACELGWITGVTPVWINHPKSTGPIHTLELRTEHTCVSISHLSSPNAAPRDSRLRYDRRVNNEYCPYLTGWEEPGATDAGPLGIVLVHGDKDPEFAFLRVYNDPDNMGSYRDLTGNIFERARGSITRIDDEKIPDVRIDILPPEDEDEEEDDAQGSSGGGK